jgi:hypothetical protein
MDRNPCQIDGAATVKGKTQAVIPSVAELAQIADTIKPERFKALVLADQMAKLLISGLLTQGPTANSIPAGTTHIRAGQNPLFADSSSPCQLRAKCL